ncbi:MAG TPA: zinc-ribbon domain-containing protein [Candidatus Omnitrophica bacterium]|nr:zinc-ribbon domain-containing protein [Candidatus Omnitrophota bacterium]
MEITEVRISLTQGGSKRLKAYATVTFDNSFVVRNIKVVEGNQGLFVAMPAKKLKQFCPRCGKKVDLGSRYCNHCGVQLPPPPKDFASNRQVAHQDLAHPINQQFRDYLQSKILDAYHREKDSLFKKEVSKEVPEEESSST